MAMQINNQENYNVGIYARLSRDDERIGESVSIENQKELLGRYAREQGWTIYDYYCDDGVSGTTFDRPEFNRLVQDATDKKINLVLCKDLSRLGRDYIEAGRYTDFVFPSLGCRFIALNDGVDTLQKNNEMLVIIKNVMNDLYARDASSKIKAVKQSTFKSGKYVGCYAPLGYKKSEADKHILEIDPITAPIVKHIFDMRLQGDSFRKIATQLNAEGVPAPRTFYYMAEGRENPRNETPYWNDVTVKTILRNEVYIGHMVQNKTGTVSYKNHKQLDKPKEEWIKVENTHEPIISQDIWEAVQRMDNHPGRGRTGKSGMIALFGGLLRCMDCGSSLRYMRDYRKTTSGKEPEFKSYVCNRYAIGGKDACSTHYINQKALIAVVLTDIRSKAILAQGNREALKERILNMKKTSNEEKMSLLKTELTAIDKRLAELDRLFIKIYEDNVAAKLSDERFAMMSEQYEDEQTQLRKDISELQTEIAEQERQNENLELFIKRTRKYEGLNELTPYALRELVKAIYIEKPDKSSGKRKQKIRIQYDLVDFIPINDLLQAGKQRETA